MLPLRARSTRKLFACVEVPFVRRSSASVLFDVLLLLDTQTKELNSRKSTLYNQAPFFAAGWRRRKDGHQPCF